MPDLEAAQSKVDEAWHERDAIRGPLTDTLRDLLASVEGVTGLSPGPGADNLIDRFLDFAEFHADELGQAAVHRRAALVAESDRNDALDAQPVAPEDAPTPQLVSGNLMETRIWLQSANPNDVRDALNEILDRDEQVEWAGRLMGWGRQDGNVAQVFEAINSVLVPPKEKKVVVSDNVLPVEPQAIESWVGSDESRAREAYDAEISRAEPRNDVLAFLVDVLDKTTPNADEPPATDAEAATGEVGPIGADAGVGLNGPVGVTGEVGPEGAPSLPGPVGNSDGHDPGPEGAVGPDGAPAEPVSPDAPPE